jgi:serine protease Do
MNKKKKKVYFVIFALSLLVISAGLYIFTYIKNHVQVRVNNIPSSLSSYDASSDAPVAVVKPDKKEIISKCRKQVYYLKAQVNGESYSASGFLYDEYGDIVTNAHVVEGASKVQVRLPDSKTEYEGVVIGIGKDKDIALVRVPELTGMKPLETEKEKEVQLGDEVIALGSPLGYQNTATIGIVSGLGRSFDLKHYHYEDVYQISAPISSIISW